MEFDATLLLKRDGQYETAGVNHDVERGKIWIHLPGDKTGLPAETLSIESPRLRELLADYEAQLANSGLARVTDDGYSR
jgi:hypothetical protein